MHWKKLGVIFVLFVCFLLIGSGPSAARPVSLKDYFAVGEIGQIWNYEYTSGPAELFGHEEFTVTLSASVDENPAHRVYEGEGPVFDPVTGALVFDEITGEPIKDVSPYLGCIVGPKSMSILPGETREGFNISSIEISRLNSAKVFEGDKYAWVLDIRRGYPQSFTDYNGRYLMIVVLDKTEAGHLSFNMSMDWLLGLPRGYENYRVLGYSYFAEGVGEFYNLEYFYIDGIHWPNGGDVEGGGDREYELISISVPTSIP